MKTALVCVVVAVLGVIALNLLYLPDRIGCYSRWSGSNFDTSYGVMAGCRVNVGGQWLPEGSVRSVQP